MEAFFVIFGIIWVVVTISSGKGPHDPPPHDHWHPCDHPRCGGCRCGRW